MTPLERLSLPTNAIVISGGRGYIGRALGKLLVAQNFPVILVSREAHPPLRGMPVITYEELSGLQGCQGVINLAGANIAGGRWTSKRRQELRHSRLHTTQLLCDWVGTLTAAPDFFISASAIGYYGDTGDQAVDETAASGKDFAALLCRDWEATVALPETVRKVILRIGVVLGPNGGALERMLPAFKLCAGGPLGHGQQWMSWIALADLLQIIHRACSDASMHGTYNAVAPQLVRNQDFAASLGKALKRPSLIRAPAWILKLLLGEMSQLLLGSQRVLPKRLQEQNFNFQCGELNAALRAAIHAPPKAS